MMKSLNPFSLMLFLGCLLIFEVIAQEQIGVASAVNKNTTDLTLEQERKLVAAGYKIIQNHVIETDGIGRAQMLLVDGTSLAVGPNSSVVLDKFVYNPITAEGSLEVTAKGLLRIVGGKVTKKQPALIRTNSATVGIRGGIAIVETEGVSTTAAFIYGTQMTVSPIENSGSGITLNRAGFLVTVENPGAEVSDPILLTEETLGVFQEGFQAKEEEPAAEETPAEETQEEEAAPNEETSSEETAADETPTEETAPESEAFAEAEVETEVISDDANDSTDIEVDEEILDSSGVSDINSNVELNSLSTAETFEVSADISTSNLEEESEEEQGETEISIAVATVASDGQVVEIVEGSGSAVATFSGDGATATAEADATAQATGD
ncbi:FecR domain-containing protein, partial [Gammaproteobacteria bacterium]|nr:FecR domain-containing protein [Gammaproteobacteria bacterium]